MKRKLFTILLSLSVVLAMTACAKTQTAAPAATTAAAPAATQAAPAATQAAPAATQAAPAAEASALPAGFPAKDITIILPYGSGSSQEAILRTACAYVEKKYSLPKSFVIVNKEGASGEIGLTAAYTAPHDGYTMAMFHSPYLTLDIVRGSECAFKYTDFKPICNFMIDPTCWYVNGSNKDVYPDFKSLVDAALANPGTISVACGGLNTSEGRFIQQIQRETGAEFKIVPIDNDAEFVAMLLGGHVDALVCQLGDVQNHVADGEFVPLIVGTPEHDAKIPDVPTVTDLGYTMESYSMRSLAALSDIPADIYDFLAKAFEEAMATPEVAAKAAELGIDLTLLTPDEIQKKWDSIHAATLHEWETNPWQ